MSNTIANVLVGVATLGIRQPNDALAEWSDEQKQAGSYSAKLTKTGSGNAGSTHVQLTPPTGITMTAWTAAITDYSFYHFCNAVTGNFGQYEFRFEDPDSDAWAEITAVPLQGYLGLASWVQTTLADTDMSGIGGVDEVGLSFSEWTLAALSTQQGAIEALTTDGDCANWVLTRVRIELWEPSVARTMFVDTIEVAGVTYTIEPGGTAPALILSSPFVDVGYTEDGVEIEYTAEETDIDVAEETFSIDRVINKETFEVRCNMAENSLANIANAMAGSVLATANIITFGDGVNKTMNLRITGVSPAGYIRTINIPKATATGGVGMA